MRNPHERTNFRLLLRPTEINQIKCSVVSPRVDASAARERVGEKHRGEVGFNP